MKNGGLDKKCEGWEANEIAIFKLFVFLTSLVGKEWGQKPPSSSVKPCLFINSINTFIFVYKYPYMKNDKNDLQLTKDTA